jgi:F0F1-type ATP synthase delta subunit
MREDYQVRAFFENPLLLTENKKKAFARIFPGAAPFCRQLVGALFDEGLERTILPLAEKLTNLVAQRLNVTFANVTSPVVLTSAEQLRIKKLIGGQVCLRLTVDRNLIGGLKITTSDGRLLDGTLDGALERLKCRMN